MIKRRSRLEILCSFTVQLWDVDDSLTNTLLRIDDSGCIVVNLDQTVRLLIRESDCLVKMGLELPIVCHSLYAKKNYFTLVNDSLQVYFGISYKLDPAASDIFSFLYNLYDL